MASGLIPLEEAQGALLALARTTDVVDAPLGDARGWLARPLAARRTQPWADLSAMDGYALGPGAGPWRIVRTIPAESREPGALEAGEAARIFTGAPLPAHAERILIQEHAVVAGVWLSAAGPVQAGEWIRRSGSDFATGQILLEAGAAVTPAAAALAAMAGHATLPVHAMPQATILATGSELVPPGSDAPGLPSSNSPMLAHMLAGIASVTDAGIVADGMAAIRAAVAAFARAHAGPALLLLTGGASVGDHDLVRPALEAEGWTIALHRIAMKPGKPLIVAHREEHIALGLPGNPVSAYVTALLFAAPLLRRMAGCPEPLPRHVPAPLAAPLPAGGARTEYLRGRQHPDGSVEPFANRDSAALPTLARANILIRVEAGAFARGAGESASVIALP